MVSCMACVAVEVCSAEVHAARSSACRESVTLGGRVLTVSFTYRRSRSSPRGESVIPGGRVLTMSFMHRCSRVDERTYLMNQFHLTSSIV